MESMPGMRVDVLQQGHWASGAVLLRQRALKMSLQRYKNWNINAYGLAEDERNRREYQILFGYGAFMKRTKWFERQTFIFLGLMFFPSCLLAQTNKERPVACTWETASYPRATANP